MTAYYNEHDRVKAATLRELIDMGMIAPGDVDERSIKDVKANDLDGYTQCHFFAGGGVWSYALRLAGWDDDRECWTGSCPCPSFSAAGKGGGFRDARHLWPDWFRLARERRPPVIFGEQADDAVGYGWLDLVQTDLEAADYAVGKAVFGACSVGAPHIRQRLYFGACSNTEHAERRPQHFDGQDGRDRENGRRTEAHGQLGARGEVCERADAENGNGRRGERPAQAGIGENGIGRRRPASRGEADGRGDAEQPRLEGHPGHGDGSDQPGWQYENATRPTGAAGSSDGSGDATRGGLGEHGSASRHAGHADKSNALGGDGDAESLGRFGREDHENGRRRQLASGHSGPLNGFWSDAIWLPCSDGKFRPTQPGLFPLVDGTARGVGHCGDQGITEAEANATPEARVHRLRLYGDAIVAQQAQAFIEAMMEAQ